MTRRWIDSGPDAAPEVSKAAALLREAKADVEPPPYARARVWVDLKDIQTRGRRTSPAWIAAGVTAAALAAAVVWAPDRVGGGDFAEIAAIEGTVESSVTAEHEPRLAKVGQSLEAGARVRTSPRSRSTVVMHDVARLELASATQVAVGGGDDRVRIDLESGAVTANVIPRKGRPPFSVVAGSWTVRVVGTMFTVQRIGANDVEVEVDHGVVEVTGPSVKLMVRAGGRFSSQDRVAAKTKRSGDDRMPPVVEAPPSDATPEAQADPRAEARPAPEAVARRSKRRQRSAGKRSRRRRRRSSRAGTRPTKATPLARAEDDTPRAVEAPPTRAPGSRLRVRKKTTQEQRRSRGAVNAAAATTPSSGPAAERRVSPVPLDVPTPKVSAPPTPGELYEAASQERDPKVAVKLFTQIASGNGPMAEQAGLRAAQLCVKMRRHRDAEARFREVLRRFPSGTYDQEARIGLIDTLVAMKKTRRALTEVEKFVARHPGSERKGELMYVRGQIARAEGDCVRALPSFEAALRGRRGPDALYFKAWCQIQTRDNDGARDSLKVYLNKYPRGAHARAARKGLEQLR